MKFALLLSSHQSYDRNAFGVHADSVNPEQMVLREGFANIRDPSLSEREGVDTVIATARGISSASARSCKYEA